MWLDSWLQSARAALLLSLVELRFTHAAPVLHRSRLHGSRAAHWLDATSLRRLPAAPDLRLSQVQRLCAARVFERSHLHGARAAPWSRLASLQSSRAGLYSRRAP